MTTAYGDYNYGEVAYAGSDDLYNGPVTIYANLDMADASVSAGATTTLTANAAFTLEGPSTAIDVDLFSVLSAAIFLDGISFSGSFTLVAGLDVDITLDDISVSSSGSLDSIIYATLDLDGIIIDADASSEYIGVWGTMPQSDSVWVEQ